MFSLQPYSNFIKYMGSKSKIIDFVIAGINKVHKPNTPILDLFAGSATLAGVIGRQVDFVSNDIQRYSEVLAKSYTSSWINNSSPNPETILFEASKIVEDNKLFIIDQIIDYHSNMTLDEFNYQEEIQKGFVYENFHHGWHLFLKNYSGTWWSAEQCLWIDAIRQVASRYMKDPCYDLMLSSLMFAMAYCSQGTGHYAQYRDAKTKSSLKDILIYRRKNISHYFLKKYTEVFNTSSREKPVLNYSFKTEDYEKALDSFHGGTVYADPPYCSVHYSRFYHILETLVLYDYPELQIKQNQIVKGRYRINRHQSPFCIKSKVEDAFDTLFREVQSNNSRLVLSYSNTGMIGLDNLLDIASDYWSFNSLELLTTDHQHMTLGRQGTRHRDVKECLLLIK